MSGNISCSQCGYKLSEQDMFCGQCGMPRDRGSNATLRSTDSQASTELVTPPSPNNTLTPNEQHSLDIDSLYREGLITQSRDDLPNLERAASFWQQVVDKNPNYGGETFRLQRRKLLQELQLKRAKQAQNAGEWERESKAWRALRDLSPPDKIRDEADRRIGIAEYNQRYTWMYENVEKLIAEGNLPEARKLLKELRRHAPYYGDPLKLTQKAGMRVRIDPYRKEKIRTSMLPFALLASFPLSYGISFLLAFLLKPWLGFFWLIVVDVLTFFALLIGFLFLSLKLFGRRSGVSLVPTRDEVEEVIREPPIITT